MRIGMMRIPCKDLGEAENFYTNMLGLQRSFGNVEAGFVGYTLENTDILLEQEAEGEFETGKFLGFSLYTDDIEKVYRDYAAKGVDLTGPPEWQFWGGWITDLYDCSGNSFSLVQMGSPPDTLSPKVKVRRKEPKK